MIKRRDIRPEFMRFSKILISLVCLDLRVSLMRKLESVKSGIQSDIKNFLNIR